MYLPKLIMFLWTHVHQKRDSLLFFHLEVLSSCFPKQVTGNITCRILIEIVSNNWNKHMHCSCELSLKKNGIALGLTLHLWASECKTRIFCIGLKDLFFFKDLFNYFGKVQHP